MTITKKDIDAILKNLDEDARLSFLSMSREDQLLVILSMEGSNSNRLAVVEKWQIDFQRDRNLYREKRENKENNEEEVTNITQKIVKTFAQEMSKQFNFWLWFRDKVLPSMTTVGLMVLLYMIFQIWKP